ncbi:conserved protein of unknown function [Paraburkholderia kururiensis]|uniref:hypothetical protein n=1 Tax=Paraburkholderia kururiensis TaxID=984307 RepID=UPI0039A69DB1
MTVNKNSGSYVTVLDTESQYLSIALERAQAFLALDLRHRSTADWYRQLREDRDSRTFFNANVIRRTPMFGVKVAEQVAKAYLACADLCDEEIAPTGRQVRALRSKAFALEAELEMAGPWVIADAESPAFREPLRRLARSPSRLTPRTAGRLPLGKRRAFVLSLAASLYALSGEFPTKFLMVATILVWEETSDRTIRNILTPEARELIVTRAAADRAARIASENEAQRLINRVSVNTVPAGAIAADARSDAVKVADALRLLKTLTDCTAAVVMVDALAGLADEFGIERSPRG